MNPSIAIQPFDDLSAFEGQAHFLGRAFAIELAHYLTNFKGSKVIFTGSAFNNSHEHPQVDYLLHGSVMQSKYSIVSTYQLLNSKNTEIIYSNRIEKPANQLSELPKQVANDIIQFLELEPEKSNSQFVDSNAYQDYLKGLYYWNLWSEHNIVKAIECFEKALKHEPEFALCWARLSKSRSMLAAIQRGGAVETNYQKARESALKAISLDNNLCEAHISLALIKLLNDVDILGAYYALKKAMNLNGNAPETRYFYSYYLLIINRYKEAIEHLRYALQYDPKNIQMNSTYGFALSLAGNFDEAESQLKKTLELDEGSEASYDALFWNYLMSGKIEKAQQILDKNEKFILHTPATQILFYKQTAKETMYNKWLKRLEENKQSGSYHRNASIAYWALGDKEKALIHLEQFYEEKLGFVMVLTHPAWKSFRDSSQFYKYKKRLKLLNPPFLSEKDKPQSSEELVIHSQTAEKITLNVDKLLFIEAQDVYSKVVWEDSQGSAQERILRVALNQIMEQTLNITLFRCHRSFIVNKKRKYLLSGNRKSMKIKPLGHHFEIPVSRSKSSDIHDHLNIENEE